MAEYLAALDVGGTKTDAVLFTMDGTVVRRSVTPGANPLDVGLDEAMRRYLASIAALRGEENTPIDTLYAGVAAAPYFGSRIEDLLRTQVSVGQMRVEADGPALISAILGHVDGASLICGTGSSLTIRKGDSYDMIGGYGYLIDGCASGYILGKRAILAAARAYDGRSEKTLISDLVFSRSGEQLLEHLPALYAKGRPYIASYAGVIFEARKMGDRIAAQIFEECVNDLNELVWTARRRLGGAYDLVLNGGIFRNFPEYVQALKALAPPDVQMIDSDAPPVFGCAVEAMWDAGCVCDTAFKKRFLETYSAL